MYMSKLQNEAAARQWSLDWTAGEVAYDQLMSIVRENDAKKIFDTLDTIERTFATDGALAYLEYRQTSPAHLTQHLEEEMQGNILREWTNWYEGWDEDPSPELICCIGDGWEQGEEGGWSIPPFVKKSREFLAKAGVQLDETTVRKWNEEVLKLSGVNIGWLIGYSPVVDPQSIAALARKVIRAHRRLEKNRAAPGANAAEAAHVLAYCNFGTLYYNTLTHDRVDEVGDAFREATARLSMSEAAVG